MKLKITIAALAALAASQAANATLTISSVNGGPANGVNKVNFDDLTPGSSAAATSTGPNGSVSVSFTGSGVVGILPNTGSYAAPFLSGNNGDGFGSPDQPNGQDATPYLSTGIGTVTVSFSGNQQYVGLLWGSVDTYNSLEFYNSANVLVGTVTGTQVNAAANGDQGAAGTFYVNINSDVPFSKIVAVSTSNAFELDNVAYDDIVHDPVPETSTYVAGGLALLPLLLGLRAKLGKK